MGLLNCPQRQEMGVGENADGRGAGRGDSGKGRKRGREVMDVPSLINEETAEVNQ